MSGLKQKEPFSTEKPSPKTLKEKAKTTREVSELIEREYDEDEMGHEYVSKINYHNEIKWVTLADVKERDVKILAILKEMPWQAELQCRKIEELLK